MLKRHLMAATHRGRVAAAPPPDPASLLTVLTTIREDTTVTTKSTSSVSIIAAQPVVVVVNVSVTSSAMSVSDGTNTYTAVSGSPYTWGSGGRISVFICENPAAVTGPVTATWTTAGRVQISVLQGVNLRTSGVLDANPAGSGGSSIGMDPVSSGALAHPNEVVLAILTTSGVPTNFVNSSGWTSSVLTSGGGNTDLRVSQLAVSSTSAVSYDANWDNSRPYGVKLISLKGA